MQVAQRRLAEYLGHIISGRGLEVDPEKIRSIKQWPKERPKEWIKWIHWAEYWFYTTYQEILGSNSISSYAWKITTPLIYYGDRETPNSTLDERLKERDIALGALKDHLRVAQEKTKKYADHKRRHVDFEEGDMVFLKIRLYRQVSIRKKKNEKLSPKFFGPYRIIKRPLENI